MLDVLAGMHARLPLCLAEIGVLKIVLFYCVCSLSVFIKLPNVEAEPSPSSTMPAATEMVAMMPMSVTVVAAVMMTVMMAVMMAGMMTEVAVVMVTN